MTNVGVGRVLGHGALAVSLWSLIVAGQARSFADDVDDARAVKEVEAQRMTRMVREAEDMAVQLAKQKNLTEATAVLRRALTEVEESTSLSDERRDKLRRELKGMIRAFDPKTVAQDPPAVRPPLPVRPRVDAPPEPPPGEFPPPPRKPSSWPKITERERAILRELNTLRTVDFTGKTTWRDVIKHLQDSTKLSITVSKVDLESVEVTDETPIKLEMKNVATRSILKKLLADLNLTYIIKDETLVIVSVEQAKATLTTRTYYVGDMADTLKLAPTSNRAAMMEQAKQLMTMIQKTYDPDSWDITGGPGSITFDPTSMSFVIRQTAEMHFLLGIGMR